MNKAKWLLCQTILQLDRIPRYGRLYRLKRVDPDADDERRFVKGPAEWTWQRYGRWGLNLLDRLGWMWEYIDENVRRQDASPGPSSGRVDH